MIVILSRDLIFCSRFHAAAEAVQLESQTALSADQAATALSGGAVAGLFIDLETPELDLPAIVRRARDMRNGCLIVAYGPHVHEARLQAAREAGCDRVLSRGQFDRELAALLQTVR